MFAIIATGGKQYLVSEGETIKVEKLDGEVGASIAFDVLYAGDEKSALVGMPQVSGATVTGSIIAQDRHEKVTGIKHKPKKRYLKKFGHRQTYTEVKIETISAK